MAHEHKVDYKCPLYHKNIQKSVVCEMSCECSIVIEVFRDRENVSEALPLEMIFLNFMMLKIPYAAKRELLIFCFCHEDIQGEMSGRKRRSCLFSDEHFDKGCRSLKKQKSSKKVLLQLRNFCRMNSDKKSFRRWVSKNLYC